jgi:hypothetical protein
MAKVIKPAENVTVYTVSDESIASLAFHGQNYPVVDGKVSIPNTDTWHLDLVGSLLKKE